MSNTNGLLNFFNGNVNNKEEIVTVNNYHFWFDRGRFDEWCVHCQKPDGSMWFAYDREYLSWIRNMAKFHGVDKVYNDFVTVYNSVDYYFDMKEGYETVCEVASHYKSKESTEHWWTYFWMAMVAEERKENAIVGKRIKRLAVYNLLFDDYKMSYVLKYMNTRYNPSMDWMVLDRLCYERGF